MKPNLNKILYGVLTLIFFVLVLFNFNWIISKLNVDLAEQWKTIISRLFHSMTWLALAFFISQVIHFVFWKKYHSSAKKNQAPKLFRDILIMVIYIAAITVIIGFVFKKPLTGFWATSGVTALILGFALRNIILDLFSGIAVNVEQPYVVGDWVQIDQRFSELPLLGKVLDINWRSTYVKTEENVVVIIPNSLITTQAIITNYTKDEIPTRFDVFFTLDYSVPVNRAKRVLLAGALDANNSEGFIREREPQVLVEKTNDLGVVYRVRYWIAPWQSVSPSRSKNIIQTKILEHLDAAGLTLAYPKEDIYYSSMPVRQLFTDNESDRIKLLSKTDLFSFLNKDEIEDLSKKLIRKEFTRGFEIVRIDEEGDSMFLLLEGLLDVYISSDNGHPLKVAQLSPGNYFGEMSLLTGQKRSATITAAADSIVFEINRESFNEILSVRENIVEKISESIAARNDVNEKMLLNDNGARKHAEGEFKQKLIKSIKSVFRLK